VSQITVEYELPTTDQRLISIIISQIKRTFSGVDIPLRSGYDGPDSFSRATQARLPVLRGQDSPPAFIVQMRMSLHIQA
jgi:hypothetical protein